MRVEGNVLCRRRAEVPIRRLEVKPSYVQALAPAKVCFAYPGELQSSTRRVGQRPIGNPGLLPGSLRLAFCLKPSCVSEDGRASGEQVQPYEISGSSAKFYPRCRPHPGSQSRSNVASAVPVFPQALHFTRSIANSTASKSPWRLTRLATGDAARCPHLHFAIRTKPAGVLASLRSRSCRSEMGAWRKALFHLV